MNYRHIYHAGNFADVLKHWILTLILEHLCLKEKPFCLIDTHAGLGVYDLQHPHAQNTLEYTSGIAKLLNQQLATEFKSYINIVNKYINTQQVYPGSAVIMQEFLRPADRLLLNELHPEDYAILRENFAADNLVKIFNSDAYQFLKAQLPPKERRALILIDPAFEKKDELDQIIAGLQEALKRFATGIYVIWYPIKDRKIIEKFYRKLGLLTLSPKIYVEIHANANIDLQLNSCGIVIVNPPWRLAETLQNNIPKLLKYLDFRNGTYNVSAMG